MLRGFCVWAYYIYGENNVFMTIYRILLFSVMLPFFLQNNIVNVLSEVYHLSFSICDFIFFLNRILTSQVLSLIW